MSRIRGRVSRALSKVAHGIHYSHHNPINRVRFGRSRKVFCIGRNKTGTTSLATLFRTLGYRVAPQEPAELLFDDWVRRDFRRIIRFARYGGEFFQDVPFSLADTYKALDEAFPSARFILTVRDSPDQWYESLIRFHALQFGGGKTPTATDLKKAYYLKPGWPYHVLRTIHGTADDDIYNRETLINGYIKHIKEVTEHFAERPAKLLTINLGHPSCRSQLAEFFELDENTVSIPWENRTL